MASVTNHHGERVIRYFEDCAPGVVVDCGTFTLTEAEIIAFAAQYDPQPFHTDPVAARDSPFGGVIASGWHSAAMMMRQLVDHFFSPETGLGSPGVDDMRWILPVRPDDTIAVRVTIAEARRSASKPDRGIVKTRIDLINGGGQLAMTVTANSIIRARNPA